MSIRLVAFALPFSLLAACGGGTSPDGTDATGSGSGSGSASDAAISTAGDAAPLTGTKYSLHWGPVTVQPGAENTQCIWMKLSNNDAVKIHQIHNTLSAASHHLIVYRDDMDVDEQTTPMDCQPFTGALNSTGKVEPIVITQKRDDEITLPTGVAYTFAPAQMVKIEMHFINTTDAAVEATADVDVYAADPTTITDEAAVLFNGTPDIKIKAGAVAGDPSTVVHEFLTIPSSLDLSHSHIFAITGHTHKHGIDVKVSTAATRGGALTSVYNPSPFEWAEPLTAQQSPDFSVPLGGGFDFECDYDNTGGAAVGFGESATDEMCFFWAYYYPAIIPANGSSGSHVCVHSNQFGGANGIDLCCPDAGSICNMVLGN